MDSSLTVTNSSADSTGSSSNNRPLHQQQSNNDELLKAVNSAVIASLSNSIGKGQDLELSNVDADILSTLLPSVLASSLEEVKPQQQEQQPTEGDQLLNIPASLANMTNYLLQQQFQQQNQQQQQQQVSLVKQLLCNNLHCTADQQASAAKLAISFAGNNNIQNNYFSTAESQFSNNSTLHNLIPSHLQSVALAPSLHGTPGYPSALIPPPQQALGNTSVGINPSALVPAAAASGLAIPKSIPLTVQDRPMTPPVYNGVNPNYPGLRVVNNSPPMFCVENFLTPYECNFLIQVAQDSFGPAPVVGKGAGEVSPSRTSSTCYLAREDVPDMMRKISILTGKPVEHCELPQVGRYFPTQQYLQHFDAFDLSTEDGCRFASNGGQRTITVLIYLNDVMRGGATRFPALNLEVQPRQGMALVFFPATIDGMLDKMALHAALPAVDTKYVSQCWIRQNTYNGQPSKRLPVTLGAPLHGRSENKPNVAQNAQPFGAVGYNGTASMALQPNQFHQPQQHSTF